MVSMIILTYWLPNHTPYLPLQAGDSAMDVTGQQTVTPDPNVAVWEVWAANSAPYYADPEILVFSEDAREI